MAEDLKKHGPYGSSDGEKWCLMLNEGGRISEMIVKSGSIIDSIAFTTIKPTDCGCGYSATHTKFGGNGGNKSNLITFQCGEYITHFSGSLGQWDGQLVVAKMKIHTNLRPDGYGSYGNGDLVHNITKFKSPPLSGGGVVGLFGTHSKYLRSIGVYGHKKLHVEKDGPYGSLALKNWELKPEGGENIKEIIIIHGLVVHAIGFVVAKPSAHLTTYMFGAKAGFESKITLKCGEYVTHISGICGDYEQFDDQRLIVLIKIHTNLCPIGYGPFGKGFNVNKICNFSSPLPSSNNRRIVGFFGRCNQYLESIGTFLEKKQEVVKYEPYGNQCACENFSMKVEGCKFIKEVIVRHAFIVDAIGFVVGDPCGSETNMFGGNGGNESKIVLKCGEFITQISGTFGEYAYSNNTCLISTIKIHTNLCPGGYGPFGTGQATENVQSFASPMPLEGRIVGFFGNAQEYLLSLGIYAEKPLLKQGC